MNRNLRNQLLLLVFFVLVWLFVRWGCLDVTLAVLLLESLYSAGCIDIFLLACIERMAGRTNFRCYIASGGFGLKGGTTVTLDRGCLVLGVDTFFHLFNS